MCSSKQNGATLVLKQSICIKLLHAISFTSLNVFISQPLKLRVVIYAFSWVGKLRTQINIPFLALACTMTQKLAFTTTDGCLLNLNFRLLALTWRLD